MKATPLYFDCDTGVDDALALALLLATTKVNLVGIGTVSGNCSAEQAARNTLDLLGQADRPDVSVAVGAYDQLVGEFRGGAPDVHGENGIGNVQLPTAVTDPRPERAAELLVRLARVYAEELHVVAVGPLTNLAIALRQEPKLATLVKHVTIMGGAALVPGNMTSVAEFNIHADPEAAAEVFAAGWQITMVPLDVTMQQLLEEPDRQRLLDSGNPNLVAVGEALDLYYDFYKPEYGRRASALHDPLAVALAIGLVEATNAPRVEVVVDATSGPGRGQTICDLRGQRLGPVDQTGAHTRVVLDIAEPLAPLLMRHLLAWRVR